MRRYMYPAQDNCTFGPVSNGQYRAYLSEVQSRQRTKWPAFSRDGQEIGRQLNFRLSDMLGDENSLYVRIAVLHAIVRAIGAEYLNTNGRRDANPYRIAPRRDPVTFNYQVDINRLVFQPYPRQLWIVAVLADPTITSQGVLEKYGELSVTANVVSIFDHPPDEYLISSGKSCPPLPTPEQAARYQTKQR
jgi:hypothetical protein